MSRLTGDKNQQQPQQPNTNQLIVQNIQQQSIPIQNFRTQQQQQQQQILTLPQSGSSYIIINSNTNNESISRTPTNVNTIQGSIYYSASSATTPLVVNQSSTNATNSISSQISTSTTHHLDSSSPIAKKRLKLETVTTDSSSSTGSNTEDLSALKKRILEHKFQRLKSLKEKHAEHVAELFFLQSNGNMMDYPAWRKKPPIPQFISFKKTYRLDPSATDDNDSFRTINQQSPEGAEIKIPGVGSTPIAISTQLPAAVAQLSKKGGTPLVPERRSIVIGSTNATTSNHTTSISSPSINSTEPAVSVKAKEEAYVLQRVQELKREGLWMGTRLPKLAEPQRIKTHWDFLLEEMQWLAADFANERKWKKSAARKCARMVQNYFKEKEMAVQKAEKAQEQNLKRIAAFIAKEIKTFWANVEKVVEIKQNVRLEAKRKKALNEKLNFIVDQTEKYSQQVAEGMNKAAGQATSKATSLNSSRISSPTRMTGSDDEWSRPNELSDDDEETIAQAEAEIPASSTNDEIDALKKESEMELDDFLKTLPKDYLLNRDKIDVADESSSSSAPEESDKEFEAINEDDEDDEDTIMEQEKTEKNADHQAEIDELKAEGEMSIDELMAKYKRNAPKASERDSDDDSTDNDESEQEQSDEESEIESMEVDSDNETEVSVENKEEDLSLKNLIDDEQQDESSENCDNGDALLNNVAALAQSIQPKGNTLSSTNVVTPIPILLRHTLREYQHIGLDWLVTMYDRKLNGILADEMGLGKTIQTIALLAHLACIKGNWGPHLIIVPSSVMLNWEMEFKKWCPGFKIMTYYGSQKERKMKRIGWTKINAFHVCITSYKLVIQDHQSFRRKKWKYLILDEAQNIKNFKSQRWQLLLNFSTERRLLLTGTPLQNSMSELWSLMHFLMPNFFESHRAFDELFSKPMAGMVEGNIEYNETIIIKLHKVLRPFLLRRLKSEVEKQMPKKYEHVVMCRLSKRQRFLYDDFMGRTKTKETLASGNLLSVINVLMQLRKVCNHPNLFETRPTISPFRMEQINMTVPSMVYNIVQYDPLKDIDLVALNLVLIQLEMCLTAFVAFRMKQLITPKKLIEEIDSAPELPPVCPQGKFKMHLRIKPLAQKEISSCSQIKVGTSPAIRTSKFAQNERKISQQMLVDDDKTQITLQQIPSSSGTINVRSNKATHQLIQSSSGQIYLVNRKQGILTANSGVMIVNPVSTTSITPPLANAVIDAVRKSSTESVVETVEKQPPSEFQLPNIQELQQEYRRHILQLLSKTNQRKCDAAPLYGEDVRNFLSKVISNPYSKYDGLYSFNSKSHVACQYEILKKAVFSSLSDIIKSNEDRTEELKEIFEKFVFVVPAVSAKIPTLSVTHMHPSIRNSEQNRNEIICKEISSKTHLLHPIASAMTTQFPDPRLIQYDCGKLQSLNLLLRQLKSDNHRVLIFTQMTRMLDVLEAFLNYHGHIYLRLDGTTKIEQRQILMERFNEDRRIFVFILSTRSGGVGINLTGADTVIFYDSDWNPTCDAQAQDRCHRIGQTRDVHIYRLISEKTIEENILKKANQKRLLGDLAIEGGNFTEAYFKNSTIQDLFNVDQSDDATARLADVLDRDKERREKLTHTLATTASVSNENDKAIVGVFESALAAAEDDQDVEAAKVVRQEAAEDLAEFDENIPITEEKEPELTKQEKEVQNLVEQLSPIERYAMRFVEDTGANWAAIQLKAVEMEIEQQKREWEQKRLAQQQQQELEKQNVEKEDSELLTYSREDSLNKIWVSKNTMETMPMWCPPTPPQDDESDLYIDYSLRFLYNTCSIMDDEQLPAIYIRKEYKRMRTDDGFYIDGRRPLKMRKDDGYVPPRSLFDRPSPALAKMRKDLKQQRNRGLIRSMPMANFKQQIPMKPLVEPEGMAEWLIFEDRAILNVIQNLQGLPLNLMLISPGHTPNWDLVADIVNQTSRTYRSPKHCRWRYEAVILPREEGKLLDSPKKQKKNKALLKTSMKNSRTPRTAQLYQNDNNNSFTKLTKMKFDAIKAAMVKKQPHLKKYMGNTVLNQKHLPVLAEMGIASYDMPFSPIDIAQRCFERLVQERNINQQKIEQQVKLQTKPQISGTTQLLSDQLSPMHIQQQASPIPQASPQPQTISQIPQQATIVVQPTGTIVTSQQSQQQGITALVHGSQRINLTSTGSAQQSQQIMKAIVASPSTGQQTTLLTGLIPQIHINPQSMQNSQSNLMQTSSVSVVLTSPPTTVTSVQPQIVSIQPTVATSTPIVTSGSIVQTINPQVGSQVVSVSQLAIGSTSLTSNSQGAAISTNPQIRQRSVSKEVIFQRPGQQNPTVISLSGLTGQGLTQLQNATLRFTSNYQPNQLRAATPDQKVVASGTKRFELVTTPQFHIYGQQQVRQKLRFLQTGPINQTGSPQTTVVSSSSGVAQTVQVQSGSGQKITVATINPTTQAGTVQQSQSVSEGNVDAQQGSPSVTVQVGCGPQQRAQFIKQVGTTQTIGQGNQKLVMLQREIPQQFKSSPIQLTTPTQIAYAPSGNLQLQQASGSSSGGQQITTLIKTSAPSGITTVAGTSQINMKLSPVRAGLAQNSTVRQVAIPQTMTMSTLQGARKTTPKVARIAQVTQNKLILQQGKEEGKYIDVRSIKSPGIFLSNSSVGNVIPVSVSQTRTETLQFVTPSTRGIASNIRLQPVQAIKMISSDNSNLLQVIGPNRRISNVPIQKTQQNVQQQISNAEQSTSQASPNQQTATPPQHSPQQK
ncbi:helicase domino isoform X2 [Chironomus tepperi]|uniref:helicase domino isoform X2 n=1 Tax=Chironomus tepperi TaxID=113505 RepID=UPI00391FB5E6